MKITVKIYGRLCHHQPLKFGIIYILKNKENNCDPWETLNDTIIWSVMNFNRMIPIEEVWLIYLNAEPQIPRLGSK